jgi:hypothetical protein
VRNTRHEIMVAEGARILLTGLYDYGVMPHIFLRREAEVCGVCQDVQRAWLRGEIASPLAMNLLWEVVWRLRMRETSL